MKRYRFSLISFFLLTFMALSAEEFGQLSYFPTVNNSSIPQDSKRLLISKMEQALADKGFGSKDFADRFVMLAKCNVLEKDIAPTTPTRITQTIEITFILGDVVENKIYSSANVCLKGIGTNETKAWQYAIKQINPQSSYFADLFTTATAKIEAYYTGKCDEIVSNATMLSANGKYDDAIVLLTDVSNVNPKCFQRCNALAAEIYQKKIDEEGVRLLNQARSVWSVKADSQAAASAYDLLNQIDSFSVSYPDAIAFGNEIAAKLDTQREKEWNQRIEQYNNELALRKREAEYAHQREMASIAAYRAIGEQKAKNQPQTTVYLNW